MKAERGGGTQRAAGAVGRSGRLASEPAGATRTTGSTHAPPSITMSCAMELRYPARPPGKL